MNITSATPGQIIQIRPFNDNIINATAITGALRIGISISEKDYMKNKPVINLYNAEDKTYGDFYFKINDKLIHMGKTCMYETETGINQAKIEFSTPIPPSLLVELAVLNMN